MPTTRQVNVRFGSKADVASLHHDVRFVPQADIANYSITSSASACNPRLVRRFR